MGYIDRTEKAMKPSHPNHDLPDFDADLEKDDVWNLLEDTTPSNPSPRFGQDTLRRIRLEADQAEKSPWWKSIFSPKPLIGFAGAVVAAIAIVVSLPSEPVSPTPIVKTTPENVDDWQSELEDAVASELLSSAAEDPTLFSDGEIVALLY